MESAEKRQWRLNKTNPTNCATANGIIRIYGSLLGNSSYQVSYKKNGTAVSIPSTAVSGVITITTLSSGSYSDFTVNILGCVSNSIAGPIVLSDPNPPTAPTIVTIAPICSGSTALIVI